MLGHNQERHNLEESQPKEHNPKIPNPEDTQPRKDATWKRPLDELTRKTFRLNNLFVPSTDDYDDEDVDQDQEEDYGWYLC